MEFKRLIDVVLAKEETKRHQRRVSQLMERHRPSDKESERQHYNQIKRAMMQIEANGSPSAMVNFMIDMKDHFQNEHFNSVDFRKFVCGRYYTVVYVLLTEPLQVFPKFWLDEGIISVVMNHFFEVMHDYNGEENLFAEMMMDHGVFSLCWDIVRSDNTHAYKGDVLCILELFMEDEFCVEYLLDSSAMTLTVMHELRMALVKGGMALAKYPKNLEYELIYNRIMVTMQQQMSR